MSLRLRILLWIAATNVAVLLLVVGAGLVTGGREPVGAAAIEEAFELASRPSLEAVARARYVRFVVRLKRGGEEYNSFRPAELREEADRAARALKRRVDAGETGTHVEPDGVTILWDRPEGESRAAYVAFHGRARREAQSPLRSVFLLLTAGTLLLGLVTYLTLDRIVLRPIARLAAAARAVTEGRQPEPLPHGRAGDEIDRLVTAFNQMTQEVYDYQRHLEERVMHGLERVRSAESRLITAQRLAATGTLAAAIAHEINNPLGGIANAVRRLREGDLPPAKRGQYFDLVLDGLERIRQVVERVLHFTPRRQEPAPLDAADVCRRAIDLARHRAERRNVRLTGPEGGPVPGIVGDAQELQHATLNLILNAVDSIPPDRPGHVRVDARREEGEVVIEVKDDGVGMDEETRRRCVDLFYSTKPEGQGTGLGLAIVQHIATDHGGSLEIESEPGKGTTVRIRVPVEVP